MRVGWSGIGDRCHLWAVREGMKRGWGGSGWFSGGLYQWEQDWGGVESVALFYNAEIPSDIG